MGKLETVTDDFRLSEGGIQEKRRGEKEEDLERRKESESSY